MKSQTTTKEGRCKRWPHAVMALMLTAILPSRGVQAQVAVTNPLEIAVLAEGNELIDASIRSVTDRKLRTATLENTIAAEFSQMRRWEEKYNSYLKTASSYASALKAGTSLYTDGVRILMTLSQIERAVRDNPQGIAATMAMTDLYLETATDMMTVFSTLKETVTEGGSGNMLSGADRSMTLWLIEDRMRVLSRSLARLALSMRYHNMSDVWYNATTGLVSRTSSDIAAAAHERWKRAASLGSTE